MALVAKMIGESVTGNRGPRWEPCTPLTPGAVLAANIWGASRPKWVDQTATHFVARQAKMLEQVKLMCVHTGDPGDPNLEWTQASPTGHLELTIQNPEAFGFVREGVEYLVRVTEVRARDRNWEPRTSDAQDDLIVRALFDMPMAEEEAYWVGSRVDGEPGGVRVAKVFPSSRVRTGRLRDVSDSALWAHGEPVGDSTVEWYPAGQRSPEERLAENTVVWIPNPRRAYIEETFPHPAGMSDETYDAIVEAMVARGGVRGGVRLEGFSVPGVTIHSVHMHTDGGGAPHTSIDQGEPEPARWVLDVEDSSILHYVDPDGVFEETLHQPAGMPGPVWDDVVEGLTRP